MRISVDTPCYYFSSVAHHRLPIFRTDKLKQIMCEALDEARRSADLLLFAYVIMTEHYHIVTDSKRWNRRALEDDPLRMDIDQIEWRRS